jgi:hypothetical protein
VDNSTLNAAYSTSLIGGSAYFDGSGDYLSTPNNAALNIDTTYSAEIWFYSTATSGSDMEILAVNGNWDFLLNTANSVVLRWFYPGYTDTGVTTVRPFTWNHIAFSISGGRLSFYVNGVRVYTNASVSITNGSSALTYIAWAGGNSVFKGYLSGLRITKGSTPYDPTSTVIPLPLTPPTAVTNTQFLTNFTNGAIFDNTAKNVVETVSGASLSTAQVKYGTTSMAFNGSSDYVVTPSNALISAWGGDFTIEGWYYSNSIASTPPLWTNSTANSDGMNSLYVYANGSLGFGKVGVNEIVSATGLWQNSRWNHTAVVRSGANVFVYLNGVQVASGAASTYVEASTVKPITLGRQYQSSPVYYNGYIQDFRVTKGYARYVANFTPPTSALQNQ